MNDYFPNKAPEQPPTPEEKARLARRFRRRANTADALSVLTLLFIVIGRFFSGWNPFDLAALLLSVAAVLSSLFAYTRCPCCGRMARRGEHLGPFAWRDFECPACWFTPDWSR